MKKIDTKVLSLAILLLGPPINYYLNTILQYGLGISSISMYSYIFIALVGLNSYRYFKKLDKTSILLFVLLVFGFILAAMIGGMNMLLSSDLNPLESPLLQVFLYCVPLYILTKTTVDFQKTFDYLFYFGLFNLILFIPSYYYSQLYLSAINVDYMSISYNVLVALCLCIGFSWDKKLLLPAIIAILSLLLLIVVGSRGATLSALIYIFILMALKFAGGEQKKVLTIATIAIIVIISLGGYYFSEVSSLIDSGDLFSRNLYKLDDNSFFSHDDRDEIRKVIETGLDKNFLGYGLLGDRIIFQNEHFEGVYAHNMLLEMRADFGIIVGPILFAVFFVKLVTSFFYLGGLKRDFLIIMIPAGFIKLWFSGSFLVSPDFYCLLALLINLKDIKRKRTLNYSNIVRNETVI